MAMLGPLRATSSSSIRARASASASGAVRAAGFDGRRCLTGVAVLQLAQLAQRRRFKRLRTCATCAQALESIQKIASQSEQSWLERLTPDPESDRHAPNQSPRPVTSGHYVEVFPTPLQDPELVVYSKEVAQLLGIAEGEIESEAFKAFFSGDQTQVPELKSWCTPYALAIMGQRMVSNCPFGTGDGYGDGRAISVGELVNENGRFELQLKGAGRTPFCRGGDGRAVLRSSVREFLASEAMHHLGVESTRALCLVVSRRDTARRAWYSGASSSREPDTVIDEPCAISTRVAPSFLRVGHVDLFARRAAASGSMEQLEQIVEHALFREYPHIAEREEPLKEKAVMMLEEFPDRLGQMVAGWLRVGFCQGNFNSDNCLVGGRTMDYGPFGWMDRYSPLFAKWTGSGEHYGFLNQPQAAIANFHTLLTSVAVLFDDQQQAIQLLESGSQKIKQAAEEVFSAKLGFSGSKGVELWQEVEPLMRQSEIDYTIFWRQLASVLEHPDAPCEQIEKAFYQAPSDWAPWRAWLQRWADAVVAAEGDAGDAAEVVARLRAVNPKYVPREWILAEAYDQAAEGDYGLVRELQELFRRPYDEQPGFEERFYRLAPLEAARGGIAVMT